MIKYYPESGVEVNRFMAKYYDILLNMASFGRYSHFIKEAIEFMKIKTRDRILDLGAGTGRNTCLMMEYLSKEGELVEIDISEEMISQFKKKCANFPNAKIIYARVDQSLPFEEKFDKVFISFVLHAFSQTVRETIIDNVYKALKEDGEFHILDWNEFDSKTLPFHQRTFFRLIECPYAFDFIKRDWKQILTNHNFDGFEESFFFKGYLRLLKAKKIV